ncbi:hypothetical protein [Billgrantia gudaonensis]|uniref:Uncharacterized protein n=1 Tax=Billgrantia gudaonensis TaxID=376427 RepID=A0A1G9AVT3_9GAMM|nr:hypothetical protein [Halomonas gudaonensis]SDK31338.1 hypothetical protein SAMN04487954_114104 [Halomonas gudaonensis]
MAASRRAILGAIQAESRERRGPVPIHLVAIAVNAGSERDQQDVERKLKGLRSAGLIALRQDLRGSGLVLTDAGRVELEQPDAPGSAKPAATPAPPPDPEPTHEPEPEPEPEPPHEPARCDCGATLTAEEVNYATQCERCTRWGHDPECYALLCDLGGLVAERLAAAREAGDLAEAYRLKGLAVRVLQATGGPRA